LNNNRTLLIGAVAFLAVILSVVASLVFPSSTSDAKPIPVTGSSIEVGSPFYQNGMQDQVTAPAIKVGSPFYQNGMQDQVTAPAIKVGSPFYQNGMQDQALDSSSSTSK
jgi:hypothetical protein